MSASCMFFGCLSGRGHGISSGTRASGAKHRRAMTQSTVSFWVRRRGFARLLVAIAMVCALDALVFVAPAAAQFRLPILFGYGDHVTRLGEITDWESRDGLRSQMGDSVAVGYQYRRITVFFIPVWTWGGNYCVYAGNRYRVIPQALAAQLVGRPEEQTQTPLLYRYPLGIAVPLILLAVVPIAIVRGHYSRNQRRRAAAAYRASLDDHPQTATNDGQPGTAAGTGEVQQLHFYRIDIPGQGMVDIVSLLAEQVVFNQGLVPQAIVGRLLKGSTDGGTLTPENFARNTAFVDFLHQVIGRYGPEVPELNVDASRMRSGRLSVIDRRVPVLEGEVQPSNILGTFGVQDGEIIPGTYEPNANHLIFSSQGFFRLPRLLHDRLLKSLMTIASAGKPARTATSANSKASRPACPQCGGGNFKWARRCDHCGCPLRHDEEALGQPQ